MNKKITFLFLITITTFSHGMEKIACDKHCDEKALKKEIDAYADAHEESHWQAAKLLMKTHDCCRPIYEKIDHLFDIAHDPNQQFTAEDLSDPWYVNTTETWKFKSYVNMRSHEKKSTLLTIAYETRFSCLQLHKIKDLLHAKINVKNNINNRLLTRISSDRMLEREESKLQLLTVAELLLQHGANPDFRISNEYDTPLITTMRNPIDPELAHLLIWYNADPYKTVIYTYESYSEVSYESYSEVSYNAFDVDKKDWLKKIVDDKNQTIFKYLLFKNHDLVIQTLPQELVDLIGYKVWEVGKNSFKTIQSQIDQSVLK